MPIADSFFHFVPTIGLLIPLEGLLSADNALVIALLVKHLPADQRQKALLYGLGGAFVLRFAAILLATQIIKFWYLQLIGALYLAYLPIKHFWLKRPGNQVHGKPKVKELGFWPTVAVVELTDLAFAIDSVLVAVSVTKVFWVIITGALIGVVLLRFAAVWLVKLLDRMPGLEHMAYVLVGWIAIKLFMLSGHTFGANFPEFPVHIAEMNPVVFWLVTASIIIGGTILARRQKAGVKSVESESLEETEA